jgi:hypothetical protein
LFSFKSASHQIRFEKAAILYIMADLEEQRRKVEELKKKILEQKTKGTDLHVVQEKQPPTTFVEAKIIAPAQIVRPSPDEGSKSPSEEEPHRVEHKTLPVKEDKKDILCEGTPPPQRATAMIALQAYAQALKQAWSDGDVSKDEEALLLTLRRTLGISIEEHESLEHEVQIEVYLVVLTEAWQNGAISAKDSERLEFFRNKFHISSDEHFRLEKQVREDVLRAK